MEKNPIRIDEITTLLHQAWKQTPELRFFQLLWAICPPKALNDFYTEDQEIINGLKNYIKKSKKTTKTPDPVL
jgi:uncharacterized protein YihD (DUF1040 family)